LFEESFSLIKNLPAYLFDKIKNNFEKASLSIKAELIKSKLKPSQWRRFVNFASKCSRIRSIMQKNKKIFLIIFVIFMLIMFWIGYDISRRTTFPGSKGNLKERISTDKSEN